MQLTRLDHRKKFGQVLKTSSRAFGRTILGPLYLEHGAEGGVWMPYLGGWEGVRSQPEVGFHLIWGWFCSSIARAGGDSTKHVPGGNKNKMQSDLSCYMISKHCSVILHEAGIVSDFIERETLQDQRLGPSHTGVSPSNRPSFWTFT